MELLAPASLGWLALLAPLILLYVLRRRRERRVVGSTLLWGQALRDLRAERPWRRLVPYLSLLLQALVLIAGAFALSRPAGAGSVPAGARVTVVVDASASMAARDEGGTRLELAQRAARAIARSLPPGGTMSLVAAANEPVVLSPSTSDVAALEAAIDRLRTRGEGAALDAAIALAAERTRGAPSGSRIVVLTDAAQDGEVVLPRDVAIEVQRVGETRSNDAIVAVDVRARPTEGAPDRAEIFARVARFGEGSRELTLTAAVERPGAAPEVVASRRVTVAADRTEPVLMTASLPPDASGRASVVRVALEADEQDALALDDVAVAPSPAARRLPVFLVGEPPASLRRALLADRDVEAFQTTPEGLAERRANDPEAPDLDGLIVFTGAAPEVAPEGDVLVVAPAGDAALGIPLGVAVEQPRIVTWDESDPRLRFVTLRDVHLDGARSWTSAAVRPLIRAESGVVAGVLERQGGDVTLLGFDPDRSDWPRRAHFVIFVRNLLERARARRAAGGVEPGPIGAPLRVPADDGEEVVAVAPDGTRSSAIARGRIALIDVPAVPGAFDVRVGRRTQHALRNLLSPSESDLRPRARFVEAAGGTEVAASSRREPMEAWPWLLGALLAVLVLEVLWGTRRGAT